MALSDLVTAAMRDFLGHDISAPKGKITNPGLGEFGYGALVEKTVGPVYVPILGDIITTEAAQQMIGTTQINGAVPGDTVTVPS